MQETASAMTMAVPDKINQNEKSSATRVPAAAAWLPPAARQKKTQGPLGRKRKREARFCVERRSDDPEPRPVIANFLPIRPVGTPPGPHHSVAHGIGLPRPGFGERYLGGSTRTRAGKGAVPPRLKTSVWRGARRPRDDDDERARAREPKGSFAC